MNPNTGRDTPKPMPGLSKRAQEMLKPRPHQIVISPKGVQSVRIQQLSKRSI